MSSFEVKYLLGKQIDQFRLEVFLGRGAMGNVFKASDTILKRPVALKLIMKEDDCDPLSSEAKRRLIREAQAAGRLSHPNIVTVYSYGETDELQYIAMEYVSGKNLAQILKEREVLEIDEAAGIVEQILLALDVACGEGIVHRDIKPANILITNDGRVKVADFGLARFHSSSLTTSGTILGTPHYMSPEQVTAEAIDTRSDIFSTGVVLYELVTGIKPFDAESMSAVIYKIMHSTPLSPTSLKPCIPDAITKIIEKALNKDVRSRYQTPKEMLKDLRAARELYSKAAPPTYATTIADAPGDTIADMRHSLRQDSPAPDGGPEWLSLPPEVAPERDALPELIPFTPEPKAAKPEERRGAKTGFLLLVILFCIVSGAVFLYLRGTPRYAEKGTQVIIPPDARTPSKSDYSDVPGMKTREQQTAKPEEKRPGAAPGALLITTDPLDANIRLLNSAEEYGNDVGLPPGQYLVEISKDGYLSENIEVSVRAGEKTSAFVRLQKREEPIKIAPQSGRSEPLRESSPDSTAGLPGPDKQKADIQVVALVILRQAEQAYREGRITLPATDSAVQYYKQALALDAENDGIYASLFSAVGESVIRAKTAIVDGDNQSAKAHLSQAEKLFQLVPKPSPAQHQPDVRKLEIEIGIIAKTLSDPVRPKPLQKPTRSVPNQRESVQPKLLKEDYPGGKILKEDFPGKN